MTLEKKKNVLLDIIHTGLFYVPAIRWELSSECPHIEYEKKDCELFSSVEELANALRELADDIHKQS